MPSHVHLKSNLEQVLWGESFNQTIFEIMDYTQREKFKLP